MDFTGILAIFLFVVVLAVTISAYISPRFSKTLFDFLREYFD